MLEIIEKLLVLQDRDRKIAQLKLELSIIPVERKQLEGKASQSQKVLEDGRQEVMHLESERKRLELEIDSKKQLIDKYSLQQFQTRRNDEFRALGNEIDNNKKAIFEIENQILDLMEKTEMAQKKVAQATKEAAADRRLAEEQLAKLGERETKLQKELEEVEADRGQLAAGVEQQTLSRYERMMKSKGETVVVGIERGVCGGCHMRLSRQTVVECRGEQNIISCLNCGRILYYTPDMDVSIAD